MAYSSLSVKKTTSLRGLALVSVWSRPLCPSWEEGKVLIDSQVGVGTVVDVLLPLARPVPPEVGFKLPDIQDGFKQQVRDLEGLRVRLVCPPDTRLIALQCLQKALENICCEWLKLEVLAEEDLSTRPDLVLWTQNALSVEIQGLDSILYTPNVVVCPDALAAYEQARACEESKWQGIFEFISQP